jgi:hypothetical protein
MACRSPSARLTAFPTSSMSVVAAGSRKSIRLSSAKVRRRNSCKEPYRSTDMRRWPAVLHSPYKAICARRGASGTIRTKQSGKVFLLRILDTRLHSAAVSFEGYFGGASGLQSDVNAANQGIVITGPIARTYESSSRPLLATTTS